MARNSKAKANRPNATSWDKISARTPDETTANRDVYQGQQLDRTRFAPKRSKRGRIIASAALGVVVMILTWVLYSMLAMVISGLVGNFGSGNSSGTGTQSVTGSYYVTSMKSGPGGTAVTCYRQATQSGMGKGTCYTNLKDVPVPGWYKKEHPHQSPAATQTSKKPVAQHDPAAGTDDTKVFDALTRVSLFKLFVSISLGALVATLVGSWATRQIDVDNLLNDTSDINQHQDDQHVALPEEIQRKFDWFPDAGAHSNVQVSSVISHMMMNNKGLQKTHLTRHATADVIDENGEVVYLKGEPMLDESGELLRDELDMIDEAYGDELFTASGLPKDKSLRVFWDVSKIPYNPGNANRDKLRDYSTVADLVNGDWELPDYEVQRPAGAYIVDTAPVNTMVLAITRAGKGQTYIEPTLDMWSREKKPSNMVINDPKGELLVKNYVPFTKRGYQIVQFNLIDRTKTDIYNPLGMAAEAAREGDATKCALYVENIADVFFPLDGGDDPVWPNAANNAFKRAAYGLIDFYMEEERELREKAARTGMDPVTLEIELDDMWGKVSLYNCYQLFVRLTSKKIKSPRPEFEAKVKANEFESDEDKEAAEEEVRAKEWLWEGKPEQDMLTLYFNATEALPTNTLRNMIGDTNNALRAMAGAEKMLASVYGIAITAMSFFTDPTISTLTSGKPSQNTDLGGFSFPRRVGVRFAASFLKKNNLIGQQALWSAYGDPMFSQPLGKAFDHSDMVSPEGWARYYFEGKFPQDDAWLRLQIVNPTTRMLIRTFYFKFTKGYYTNLTGRRYIKDPVTGEKIIKHGVLRELRPVKDADGVVVAYKSGSTSYRAERLEPAGAGYERVKTESRAVVQTMVRYSEQPKALFLLTPPHLLKYAKLSLILLKQLVDLNFDRSYMTKADQKPLYRTRFMLDEVGNLQSDGHGIAGLETMLSIGLGQEQQFTLILQTLQQILNVYGNDADKIIQGNAAGLDTLVATPSGWCRMGDIRLGQEVLTPFGGRTKVTGVFPRGVRPVYRVTLRDGSSSEVCEEHLWQIERWKSSIRYLGGCDATGRRRYEGAGPAGETAVRVSEVLSTLDLKERVDAGKAIDLPRIEPLDYDPLDLPVDPYVLGVILGDGHIAERNGFVHFSKSDAFVVDELRRRGVDVGDYGLAADGTHRFGIRGIGSHMRALGLAGQKPWTKAIPEQYLYGSIGQRLDLLRGLMDTDGTISARGEIEFTSASRQLAEGVQTLVRSLGGRVSINVKTDVRFTSPNQATRKAARDAYRVQNIRLQHINPFLLPRKADRWRLRTDNSGNRVISVEYVRDEPVQCIRVADERHLYVMNDFMPTHNTSNIIFLKSTDDTMIETLEKMSGTRHVSYKDSKQVSQDLEKMMGSQIEGRVSYTISTTKEPVISYNNMAFIAPNNNMVFRAGDSPVWNRNETILPMMWKLAANKIVHPGHDYSLQTIPTLSTAMEFDVRTNQPDFTKMLDKRMAQAVAAQSAKTQYQSAYDYSDFDIERLDPDNYSDEVMELVTRLLKHQNGTAGNDEGSGGGLDPDSEAAFHMFNEDDVIEDDEVKRVTAQQQARREDLARQIYAEDLVSRDLLINLDGSPQPEPLQRELSEAYRRCRTDLERDHQHFSVGGDGSLCSADGSQVYVTTHRSVTLRDQLALISAHKDPKSGVFSEYDDDELASQLAGMQSVTVTGEFCRFLASLKTWENLAGGAFERAMAIEMRATRGENDEPSSAG